MHYKLVKLYSICCPPFASASFLRRESTHCTAQEGLNNDRDKASEVQNKSSSYGIFYFILFFEGFLHKVIKMPTFWTTISRILDPFFPSMNFQHLYRIPVTSNFTLYLVNSFPDKEMCKVQEMLLYLTDILGKKGVTSHRSLTHK